jgi:hypothetical protein
MITFNYRTFESSIYLSKYKCIITSIEPRSDYGERDVNLCKPSLPRLYRPHTLAFLVLLGLKRFGMLMEELARLGNPLFSSIFICVATGSGPLSVVL